MAAAAALLVAIGVVLLLSSEDSGSGRSQDGGTAAGAGQTVERPPRSAPDQDGAVSPREQRVQESARHMCSDKTPGELVLDVLAFVEGDRRFRGSSLARDAQIIRKRIEQTPDPLPSYAALVYSQTLPVSVRRDGYSECLTALGR